MRTLRRLAMLAAAAAFLAAPTAAKDPIVLTPSANDAFKPGEKLKFGIKYEFVSAGTATMEVSEGPLINGRPTLNLQSTARSNGFIDKIFKVRDFNGSTIDRASLATVHFHQNLKEGKYHVIRNTQFDYPNKSYRYERIYKGKTTLHTGPLASPVQDILSSFFVARTLPLEPGKDYLITVFSDKKTYPLAVRVLPGLETVKVAAGTFECLRVEPDVQGDSIFRSGGNRMTLYLTNDSRHMPVLIRSRVAVGSFDAELETFTN